MIRLTVYRNKAQNIWPAAGQISYRLWRVKFCHRSNIRPCKSWMFDRSWPVKYQALWGPDIWPVTASNSPSRYVQAPNGIPVAIRQASFECSLYYLRDSGSRSTDDLNRST